MNQIADRAWFEMQDLRKSRLNTATWVPLFTKKIEHSDRKYLAVGFQEEWVLAVTIFLPYDSGEKALKVDWMHVAGENRPWVQDGIYYPADAFIDDELDLKGTYAVLEQSFDGAEPRQLHLHQDLVFGLGLLREGDKWLRPEEDYLDVVRLGRGPDGNADAIIIRAEHLRDYLAATRSGLLVATFRNRRRVFDQKPNFDWDGDEREEEIAGGKWKGFIREIDETGSPYGSEVAIFKFWRTDVDYGQDIPVFPSPPDHANVAGETKTFRRAGKKLILVMGDMWKNEWIERAPQSPRVRRDRIEPAVPFIIDSAGTRAVASRLINETRWLWFRPSVITEILQRRGAKLGWYSEETGAVGLPCHSAVHFGVNPMGLINVFAKDIGLLPEFVQKLWVGHNVSPDGPVSPELLSAQMECKPAGTKAPELLLMSSLDKLHSLSKERFGESIFKEHPIEAQLKVNVNRFYSVDLPGACRLCKEINRFVVDRLNVPLLKRLTPNADKQLGSIKRLGKLLDQYGADGNEITKALVGVYELRHADAHLPPKDLEGALALLGIQMQGNFLEKGKLIIARVWMTIDKVAEAIRLVTSQTA